MQNSPKPVGQIIDVFWSKKQRNLSSSFSESKMGHFVFNSGRKIGHFLFEQNLILFATWTQKMVLKCHWSLTRQNLSNLTPFYLAEAGCQRPKTRFFEISSLHYFFVIQMSCCCCNQNSKPSIWKSIIYGYIRIFWKLFRINDFNNLNSLLFHKLQRLSISAKNL
jgi:hypothetical protein